MKTRIAYLFGLLLTWPLLAEEAKKSETKALPKVEAVSPFESGVKKFFAGDFAGSVADFDAHAVAEPAQAPHLWQRGLALYCAGKFAEGRRQFEDHQKVNPNDVENAAWHFNCVARAESVEAARKALIPIAGDARVPMAEVHALYAGQGTAEAVLKAAEKGDGERKRNQLCYAHLYLGLYEEALGHRQEALAHYEKAAKDFAMKHYMGETARVFFESRSTPVEKLLQSALARDWDELIVSLWVNVGGPSWAVFENGLELRKSAGEIWIRDRKTTPSKLTADITTASSLSDLGF